MLRPWQRGLGRRSLLLRLAVVAILGVGWAFGTRLFSVRDARADLRRLNLQQEKVFEEILTLRQKLADASLPHVVEHEARRQLRWGFPSEERIVLIWR